MNLGVIEIDRIIEMAWEDRTTFEAIEHQFKLNEQEVIKLMRTSYETKKFSIVASTSSRQKNKTSKTKIF